MLFSLTTDTWKPYVQELYDCYLLALGEYTMDSRGDIGAWVRQAAMAGLQLLTNLVSLAKLTSVLNENVMAQVIGGVAQQAVERIDRIRAQAGTVFSGLIHRYEVDELNKSVHRINDHFLVSVIRSSRIFRTTTS